MCKDKLQLTLTFNALGDRRKYDRYANGNKVTYNYTTPVQNIGISLVWRFFGGKSVNVNAVKTAHRVSKRLKILDKQGVINPYINDFSYLIPKRSTLFCLLI